MALNTTISTLSFSPLPARTVTQTVDQAIEWIDLAAHDRPDLIVLPEGFAGGNDQCAQSEGMVCASAEPIGGPTVSRIAERAARHQCYICAAVFIERGGKRFNSVVVLDRSGEVAGVYDKVYPTILELEQGRNIMPGREPVVVETDFGRVGSVVCFDLNFDDLRRAYACLNPDLLVFASMFAGGMLMQAWALLNHCYVVSAYGSSGSVFVNPLGRVLAVSGLPHSRILTRRINLDYEVLHLDYNQRKLDDLRLRYGATVDIDIAEPEGLMVLTSLDERLTARDICEDMELEPIDAFFARSLKARQQAIENGPIPQGPSQF
jgi:predicted amidohydrolase